MYFIAALAVFTAYQLLHTGEYEAYSTMSNPWTYVSARPANQRRELLADFRAKVTDLRRDRIRDD